MQQVDAERRIKILRGERPPTPPPAPSLNLSEPGTLSDRKSASGAGGFRKRRRIAGEDDTDRDIRYAREDAAQAVAKREELMLASRKADTAQAPILDKSGHINLFPAASAKTEKNSEAEAEAARKKRSYGDQYTMRFSNAAGFKESIGQKPWYSAEQNATAPESMSEKDVWGTEDPRRKERVQARMSANDPLAVMKRGVRQLKATEQERKRWNEEKRRETEALKAEEVRQSSHRRRRSPSVDSLDGFKLDAPDREREKDRRSSDRHHHRRRDRSRDRSHHRHNHHRSRHHSSHRSHRYRHDERPEAVQRERHTEANNRA